MGCTVIGSGKAVPRKIVSNDDLAKLVDTSDEWIVQRTGIHNRRIAIEESSTDLASAACLAAMGSHAEESSTAVLPEAAGWSKIPVDPASIDLLICMTITPDTTIPSQASLVKMALGLDNAIAFDLNAACSGCVYGINVAESMMAASHIAGGAIGNKINRALVVGVERLSRITDWTDRATCVLFGDGAGAVLLEWNENKKGILSTFMKNTDDVDMTLRRTNLFNNETFPFGPADAAVMPFEDTDFIGMNGQAVFKFAGNALAEAINTVLDRAQFNLDDVSCIVPHQANERIIKYAAKRMGLPLERFQVSIAHRGNSSSACIPMTLCDAYESGNTSAASALMALCDAYRADRINENDAVIMSGFGGGLTSGAVLFIA